MDVRRVAEVIVDVDGRSPLRGSGYRVRTSAILTAGHVVKGARSIHLRFDGGLRSEWTVDATVAWSCPEHDVAVLAIATGSRDDDLADTELGGVPDEVVTLNVRAIGFPRFKLRSDNDGRTWYRDMHQADGTMGTASNRMEGTLEVRVAPPRPDPDSAVSPWEGMSGAALWCRDQIVGVLAKHYGREGDGCLTAVRLDRCVASLGTDKRARLVALTGVSPSGPLATVRPSTRLDSIRRVHQAMVREDFAPLRLRDRERELAELAEFCEGRQPYLWLQGAAWSGKTALLSWFVLNPPREVDVVSFFVTRRLSGAADGDAFLTTVARQLSASADDDMANLAPSRGRGWLASLFESAASRARDSGKVLLLVVDGLDEESTTGADFVSIAALLPRHPPDNMRVVVSSRPELSLPGDMPDDHPLRTCQVRALAASRHASQLEHNASTELAHTLRETGLHRQVLGLIAAARGGLTSADLAELTGRGPEEIADLLAADLGRSVTNRPSAAGQLTYFLSHDTVQTVIEHGLDAEIDDLRNRLHAWSDTYRQRNWPDDTPRYLLHDYPNLLVALRDLARLAGCATDRARHDMLRRRSGNDFLAIAEIDMAYQLNVRQHTTDLPLALRLALRRDELGRRYEHMPSLLPAVWAKLGEYDQAESLARLNSGLGSSAISQLAETIAESSDRERAEAVAGWIGRVETLAWIAELAGDHERADQLALDPSRQEGELLARLSVSAESAGNHDRAELLAHACGYPNLTAKRAKAAADRGDFARAEALARSATDYDDGDDLAVRAEALIDVAESAANQGDQARTQALRKAAEELAQSVDMDARRWDVLARLAAFDGDWDLTLSCAMQSDSYHPRELDWLVARLARAGEYDRAESLARSIPTGVSPAWELINVVGIIADKGDYQRAERLARSLPRPMDTAEAFARLAWTAAEARDGDRSRRFIAECERSMGSTSFAKIQADGLISVLETVVKLDAVQDRNVTRSLIRLTTTKIHQIADHSWRRHVLERLIITMSTTDLAQRANSILRSSTVATDPAWGQCILADDAARTGDRNRARDLIHAAAPVLRTAPETRGYRHALGLLVRAATLTGEHGKAAETFHAIRDPVDQHRALALLTKSTSDASITHIESLARSIADPYYEACALVELALMATRSAAGDLATQLLRDARDIAESCAKPHQTLIALEAIIKAAIELESNKLAHAVAIQAIELAAVEENGLIHARKVRQILRVAATVCDRDEILSMIESAEDAVWFWGQGDRDRELGFLVREVAHDVRDYDLAERLAASVSSSDYRAEALAEIVTALSDAGLTDRAHAVFARAATTFGAGEAPNPHGALQALAKAADRIGEHDKADEFVARLYSPGERARALIALVESDLQMRVRCGDPGIRDQHTRRALKRAAEALAAEVWTEIHWIFQDGTGPLTLAVRVDPRCVDALLEVTT